MLKGLPLNRSAILASLLLILIWAYVGSSIAATIALLAICVFLFLFIRHARWGFVALIILKPVVDLAWDVNLVKLGGTAINTLRLIGFVTPILCLIFLVTMRRTFKMDKLTGSVVLFTFLNFVSAGVFLLDTLNIYSTLFGVLTQIFKMMNGFLIFITLPFVFERDGDAHFLMRVLLYSALMPTILSVVALMTGSYNVTMAQGVSRYAGLYHDAGGLSINAFIGLTIGAFFLDKSDSPSWIQRGTAYFLLATNLFLMYSAVTRIMYAVTLLFFLLWIVLHYRQTAVAFILIPVAAYFAVTSEAIQQRSWKEKIVIEEYERTGKFGNTLTYSAGGRFGRWEKAIDIIEESSLAVLVFGSGEGVGAHNEYLDTIIRTGFVGLFTLIFVFAVLFSALWRNVGNSQLANRLKSKLNAFGYSLLCCYCLMSFTGYTITQTTLGIYVWGVLAIAIYIAKSVSPKEAVKTVHHKNTYYLRAG